MRMMGELGRVGMRTKRSARVAVAVALVWAGISLMQRPASAYSGSEHMRFPDQAYQLMNVIRHGGGAFYGVRAGQPALTDCPANICTPSACPGGCAGGSTCAACVQWNRFVTEVMSAPAKLDNVLVDLSDPQLTAPECAGVFPTLPAGKHFPTCRAGDLSFAPRRGWGGNPSECYLRPGYFFGGADQRAPEGDAVIRPFFQDLPSNFTGSVLGVWATGPDDEFHDTALWFRPSNAGFVSELKGLAEGAVDVGLTLIAAPIFCLADFIFSGNDCISDAENFSHTVDPVTLVDEGLGVVELSTIGQATITSDDWPLKGNVILQGLFHFASVAKNGQFNHLPGYKGVDADIVASGGPKGWSVLDTTVIALCDLLGLTIQPDKSQGVVNYSPYADGETRNLGDWIDPTMGHAEFEPVDNLARFGWDSFVSHSNGAKGLGWVLHAIGDASQPHHTAAVLGYGHGPWERFALLNWQRTFHEEDVKMHYPHLAATLRYGFRWWKFLDDLQTQRGTTALPVGDMIEALATETFSLPVTRYGHAFQAVTFFDTPSPDDSDIRSAYDPESAAMQDLMERAIGASVGFLAKASGFVPAAPFSPCACGSGSSRLGVTAAGDTIPARDGICHPCGMPPFDGLPLWDDGECVAACPPDKPTAQGGICTSAGACPAAKPFFENSACVAHCASTSVVVDNRNCVAGGCPSNTTPDEAHFCIAQPPTLSPAICVPTEGDVTGACCSQDGGLCVNATDCCSHGCRGDGICFSSAGTSCAINNDCLSGLCTGGHCQTGHTGQACATGRDCFSGKCDTKTFVCQAGDPGTVCNGPEDCLSALCTNSGICLGQPGAYCAGQNNRCYSNLCSGSYCVGTNGAACQNVTDCVGNTTCVEGGICCSVQGGNCVAQGDCCSGPCNSAGTLVGQCVAIDPG